MSDEEAHMGVGKKFMGGGGGDKKTGSRQGCEIDRKGMLTSNQQKIDTVSYASSSIDSRVTVEASGTPMSSCYA